MTMTGGLGPVVVSDFTSVSISEKESASEEASDASVSVSAASVLTVERMGCTLNVTSISETPFAVTERPSKVIVMGPAAELGLAEHLTSVPAPISYEDRPRRGEQLVSTRI